MNLNEARQIVAFGGATAPTADEAVARNNAPGNFIVGEDMILEGAGIWEHVANLMERGANVPNPRWKDYSAPAPPPIDKRGVAAAAKLRKLAKRVRDLTGEARNMLSDIKQYSPG